jgi:hypothetical protein
MATKKLKAEEHQNKLDEVHNMIKDGPHKRRLLSEDRSQHSGMETDGEDNVPLLHGGAPELKTVF